MSTPNPVDLDFIAIRHKLVDVAAFLDRVERTGQEEDFRVRALTAALPLLNQEGGQRAKQVLEHFSDLSTEPIDQATEKGACGAVSTGEDS